MLARSTQTNEPARCAALLPVLTALPQPLALLEVGASAGLCLLPERYGYQYGSHRLLPAVPEPGLPVFPCDASAATPLPARMPRIVWRAGLDLDPIDLDDAEQVAWLETLVWPEQADRLARLRAAIAIARSDKPRLVRGDLRYDLPALAAQAPADATLVVFHTAVLAYVADPAERAAFGETVRQTGAVWIANEAPTVLAPRVVSAAGSGRTGDFLLLRNGVPLAWTDPHGASITWIVKPPDEG